MIIDHRFHFVRSHLRALKKGKTIQREGKKKIKQLEGLNSNASKRNTAIKAIYS